MFSRRAETRRGPSKKRGLIRAWRSASITARLAILYAVLTLAILSVVTLLLYWAVTVSLGHDDERFLGEKVHVLRTMLAERPDDQALLHEEVDWETGVIGHARYFVQISNGQGQVLNQTPGLQDSGINLRAFPAPIAMNSTRPRINTSQSPAGRRYLLTAATAHTGTHGLQRRVIRLAVDVSNDERILGDFRRIAELVLLFGVFLSALLGAGVARYGLRPLGRLARTVEATTALRLDQRIEPGAWPREFVPLAVAFNQLLAHLEEAFTRLSGYAADLAHELRTPINNLMGEAEVTLARRRDVTDYEQTLASNLEEYQRLARIIDRLLFLARAENTAIRPTSTSFDAGAVLQDVVDVYRPTAEEAGVTLVSSGHAPLAADRDLFRRVLSNLLDNAIRHSERGDRIDATVRRQNDGTVTIAIADTGHGIADEEQERVFDRFFRSAADRSDGAGSGLGLAIVQSIMRLHGGDVRLASELGQGTVVTLRFPHIRNSRQASRHGQ